MVKSAAGVWTVAFKRGADRRWQLETGEDPLPDTIAEENLQLPEFWNAALQAKSREFLGAGHANKKLTMCCSTSEQEAIRCTPTLILTSRFTTFSSMTMPPPFSVPGIIISPATGKS